MALREIYKVFATQIVTSDTNPQGVLSDISNYKTLKGFKGK